MESFKVANLTNREQAKNFINAVDGETYMDFKVLLCPAGGSFDVVVTSNYDAPREDIQDMLMSVMFDAI